MGRPIRSGATQPFTVSIRPLVKTCPEEVGIGKLSLPDGTPVIVVAHAFYPSHDRPLIEAVKEYLADLKKKTAKNSPVPAIFMLGGMIHEDAFKVVVDDDQQFTQLTGVKMPPEIETIRERYEGLEDRFLALSRLSGKFIAEFAEVSGGHVYYIPSVTGMLPNEIDIQRYVLEQKVRADKYADNHPEEAKRGTDIPKDWAEFLGIHAHRQISVLPFGAAVLVNNEYMFRIGDFRRRHPGSASKVDFEQSDYSTVRSFDGKVFSGWMSLPLHNLAGSARRYVQFHEVGHLYDIKAGLGYLRRYDRRSPGFWVGTIAGGKLFGHSVPILPGKDGRRGFVVNGVAYEEPAAPQLAKFIALPAPVGGSPSQSAGDTPEAQPHADSRAKDVSPTPQTASRVEARPEKKPAAKPESGSAGKTTTKTGAKPKSGRAPKSGPAAQTESKARGKTSKKAKRAPRKRSSS